MSTADEVQSRPRSSILEQLNRKAPAAVHEPGEAAGLVAAGGAERADPLPRAGNAYMAHARRSSKPLLTLFLVSRDYLPDGHSYANLERVWMAAAAKEGAGPVLMLRFAGSVVTEVAIEGRNLFTLCNAIGEHLMPWVHEQPVRHDFGDDADTVVRRITVRQPEA